MLELLRRFGYAPRKCTWELTLACNLRCGHCGSRAGEARPDELDTSEALRLCDDLAALGCRQVTLAGGEPTLRPDWTAIARRLRERGVLPAILSNGTTWSRQLAAAARAAGVDKVGFSLDGLERAHDCVRKAPHGHRRVLEAIDRTVEAGLRVVAVTHVTRRNLPELESLHQLLGRHGVSMWQVQLGVPMGNMIEDREAVLAHHSVLELIPRLAALARTGRRPRIAIADNIGYYSEHEVELRGPDKRVGFWLGCRAGIDVVGIESHGAVKGCLSLPSERNGRAEFVEGNLRERSLADIWRDPDAFAYNRRFTPDRLAGGCAGCAYGEICRGGCTWTSVSHTGQPHAFPPCYYRLAREAGRAPPVAAPEPPTG
jgi:radical SAM protein with 4Fe4S-binding SPASM domain